jgi:hypothetical protein
MPDIELNKIFKNGGKDIKYLNRDFTSLRSTLIDFSKTYFPKTYSDFNETSPGMLFIEMASYIGDSLSYYIDDTLKENLMVHAEDPKSVIALSQFLGYTPRLSTPATVVLSVYQTVPAIFDGTEYREDTSYLLRIKPGMAVSSTNNVRFITEDVVDFSEEFNRDISVYEVDEYGNPVLFLVRKEVTAISADFREETFSFGTYAPYPTIRISTPNIIRIQSITDSSGNIWYEVPYLAQETVVVEQPNITDYNTELAQFRDEVPSLLKFVKTARRFTTRIDDEGNMVIQFGAGQSDTLSETLIPNLKNVGLGLPNSVENRVNVSIDPTNFLKTRTYGITPVATELTVRYLVGGGVQSNVGAGEITTVERIEFDTSVNLISPANVPLLNNIQQSVAVDNEDPATGGRGAESIEEIRNNALAHFSTQNRAVTTKDYEVRILSLPSRFGSVAKVFAVADGNLDNNSPSSILASPSNLNELTDIVLGIINNEELEDGEVTEAVVKTELTEFLKGKSTNRIENNNPFAVNLYVLGYDKDKKLTNLNLAVKENLKKFINQYRMLTDGINIIDGFVVNIGIDFDITVFPNYNKGEVILNCIEELKEYFNIDKWTFNNTIILSDLELLLASVDGVKSVSSVSVKNVTGPDYPNGNSYNIDEATVDGVIYPSLDPCVFEIRNPNKDIRGRAK